MINIVVPGPVSDFNAQAFSSYIFANWGEPAEKNGILLGYSIGAVKHGDKEPIKPVSQVQFVDLPIDKFEHLFKDMDPESRYVIYLQAKTKIGPGPVMKADVKTIAPASKYFEHWRTMKTCVILLSMIFPLHHENTWM